MLRHWSAHLRLRSGKRALIRGFLVGFGGLWLALEPLGYFFPKLELGWQGYVALLVLAALGALWTARPRTVVERDLPPSDVHIEIRVGDLLEQTGNVVVGVTDTFDTELEGGVISPRSVQGQLLTRAFGGDRAELDAAISRAVAADKGVEDPTKQFGKRSRFPIGTVAVVERGEARYFLPVFTRMSSDLPPRVSSSVEDLYVALARTWNAVDDGGHREPVHSAVMGSNLARLGLTRTLLIQVLVLSFIASSRRGGPPRLTVWVHDGDRDTVDLQMLDEWLRGLCAA